MVDFTTDLNRLQFGLQCYQTALREGHNVSISKILPLIFQLRGQPYSLDWSHFMMEPMFRYQNTPRRLLWKTARQTSKSTSMAASQVLRAAIHPNYNILTIMPLYEQVRKFSTNYVRPFIITSGVKSHLVGDHNTDSVLQRAIGNNSNLFYSYSSGDPNRVRGIAADEIDGDECVSQSTLVLAPGGAIQIRNLREGDLIYAFDEHTNRRTTDRVVQVVDKGKRPVWRLRLRGGSYLDCTDNERLWTPSGWIYLSEALKRSGGAPAVIAESASTSTGHAPGRRGDEYTAELGQEEDTGAGEEEAYMRAAPTLCTEISSKPLYQTRRLLSPQIRSSAGTLRYTPQGCEKRGLGYTERLLGDALASDFRLPLDSLLPENSGGEIRQRGKQALALSFDLGGCSVLDHGRREHGEISINFDPRVQPGGGRTVGELVNRAGRARFRVHSKEAESGILECQAIPRELSYTRREDTPLHASVDAIQAGKAPRGEVDSLYVLREDDSYENPVGGRDSQLRREELRASASQGNSETLRSTQVAGTERVRTPAEEFSHVRELSQRLGDFSRACTCNCAEDAGKGPRRGTGKETRLENCVEGRPGVREKAKGRTETVLRACEGGSSALGQAPGEGGSAAQEERKEEAHKATSGGGKASEEGSSGPVQGETTLTETVIESIEYLGEDTVYDIETEKYHTFFANGIAVHNCQDLDLEDLPVIESCMGASPFKVVRYTGTPKTFDNTIHVLWEDSSQAHWMIPCQTTGCKHVNRSTVEGDLLAMIGDTTLICCKCGKQLNSRLGWWEHDFPERQLVFPGYHVPQPILPMHYERPSDWSVLLEFRDTKPTYAFYNECLGESYDSGAKLITAEEIKKACTVPAIARPADMPSGQYIAEVLGIDWGGRGKEKTADSEDFISNTAFALAGMLPDGKIDVTWLHKVPYAIDLSEESTIAVECASNAHADYIALDYGGQGNVQEALVRARGWPSERVVPFTYSVMSPTRPIVFYNPPTSGKGIRSSYTLDKPRSIRLLCELVKRGQVRLPDDAKYYNDHLRDFLAVYEEVMENPNGSPRRLIKRMSRRTDDIVHAINFAVMALFHSTQTWPAITEAFIEKS